MARMPDALAFPFRFDPSGHVATVDADSPAGHAQHLGLLILTRRGERDLAPSFGVPDPQFDQLDPATINAATALYGPPVTVTDVDALVLSPTRQHVTLTYDTRDDLDA